MTFAIGPQEVDLAIIAAALRGPINVELDPAAHAAITRSAATVEHLLKSGDALYGINTGFGKLAKTRIASGDLKKLQINIVRSHAAGVGAPLPEGVVRLIMLLKLRSLAQGASGISIATAEALAALINADKLASTCSTKPFSRRGTVSSAVARASSCQALPPPSRNHVKSLVLSVPT